MNKEIRIPVLLMLIALIGVFAPTTKIERTLKLSEINLTAMVSPPSALAFSQPITSASLVPSKTIKPTKTKAATAVVANKIAAVEKLKQQKEKLLLAKLAVAKKNVAKGKVSRSKVVSRSSPPVMTVSFEVSAYSPTVDECDGDPFTTASGKRVYVGGVAADLSRYPLGTILLIPNYNNGNPCRVVDSGGAIKKNKLDVFFWHTTEAINWGRRKNVQVKILYLAPK